MLYIKYIREIYLILISLNGAIRMDNIIEVSHLSKVFSKPLKEPGLKGAFKSIIIPKYQNYEAVKDLSFTVPKGQILGFIGPNGAGKSTTIKMLTGILNPTYGSCRINGFIPQKNRPAYVKEIGVVFGQRTQLWWDLALTETYAVLKEIYDIPDSSYRKRMEFLNEVLDLEDFISSPVRTLSLGQRMRADIAASLLHSPKVLFLDEPTIGLDVSVKDNIRKAITHINQEEETTIILTTHDLSDIESLCNRIFMIDKGQKIFDGSINQLKKKFGRRHSIQFSLVSVIEKIKLDLSLFPQLEVFCDGNQLTITFDAEVYRTPDLIQEVTRQVSVNDIKIKETDIEEIIRRFYRKELS